MPMKLHDALAVQFSCQHLVVIPGERGQQADRVYGEHKHGTCPRCGSFGLVHLGKVLVQQESITPTAPQSPRERR